MKNCETITIEKVGNGFIVRPVIGQDLPFVSDSLMVFNEMGIASSSRDSQRTEDTLLGFIEKHFT